MADEDRAVKGTCEMHPDSTLNDVLLTLSDPEEYVRGIVGSFVAHRFNREEAIIRIGISGAGIVPNYYIEEPIPPATITVLNVNLTANRRREVFSGRNHRQILDDCPEGESWSLAAMTFVEVQSALGKIRASRRAH